MFESATFSEYFDKLKSFQWKRVFMVLALSFLLATSISWVLSYLIMPDKVNYIRSSKVSVSRVTKKWRPSLDEGDREVILERNIFNIDGETGEESEIELEDEEVVDSDVIVKSSLPMKLIGTIYGGDPSAGIALIEDTNKRSLNSFFVGERLLADALLIEIHRERIIIERPNHKEFLELDKKEIRKRRSRKSASTVSEAPKVPKFATEPPPDAYKEEGFERQGRSIVMSSDFRKKLLTSDFAKVLQDAKAEPHFVGGELGGFRLTRIRQDSIYQKAGLQNGDVIREINGVSLVDTAQAIKLLNSLRGESEIELRLERSGSTMNLNMQVR